MGQDQASQDISRNHRRRTSRKALYGICLALVGAVAFGSPRGDAQDFNQARAWDDLTKQVAFGFRIPGTEAHTNCREYITAELKKSCENVRLQELSHVWSKTGKSVAMQNIIGEQNWANAKTRVLLIAHWDTRPTADQESNAANRAKPIPGANDGASGVAVLLELARVMKGNLPKDTGVMYLMSDGEDLGPGLEEMFLGAEYFAKNLPEKKPTYGILLDMIGDKDLAIPMEPNSMHYAGNLLLDFYRNAANAGVGKAFPMIEGPEIEDDHLSLNEAGVPTVDLIDFDYPSWHKLSDTPDKCSAESLGKVGKALQSWLKVDPPYTLRK
jgi:glutaminyl-peptide cyclotransferase